MTVADLSTQKRTDALSTGLVVARPGLTAAGRMVLQSVREAFADRCDEFFGHTPNLIDKSNTTVGYVSTANGSITSNASYFTTQPMPVTPGASYVSNVSTPGGTGYVWLTAAGAYISGGTLSARTAITAPTTAAFLRASFLLLDDEPNFGTNITFKDIVQIVEGTTPPTYRSFGYADDYQAFGRGQRTARLYVPSRVNLFDRLAATISTLIARNGTTSSNASYFMTDYLPVRQGVGIALSVDFVPGNSSYGWQWYDRDLNRIGSSCASVTANTTSGSPSLDVTAFSYGPLTVGTPISGTGIPAGAYITAVPAAGPGAIGTYTMSANATASGTGITVSGGGALATVAVMPPEGAHFARISVATVHINRLVVADGAITSPGVSAPGAYSAPGFVGVQDQMVNLPWARKNIALLGDSIMQDATGNNAMQDGIERITRAIGVIFGGISGRKVREILGGATGTYARGPTGTYVSGDFASIDLVLSNAATNDFGIYAAGVWGTPRALGALGDTGASSTFYGDLYDIFIAKLQTYNPAMRIALMTPLPRFDNGATGNPTNTNGVTLSQYADAITAFGARYAIPVLDLFKLCGFNTANSSTFYTDGLHPNLIGQETRLAPLIGKWLNTL